MSRLRNRQRGATLLVGLIVLVIMTLVVISAIRTSSTDLRIVGNVQIEEEAVTAAQQGIEEVLSNPNFTLTPPTSRQINGYTVVFTPAPQCLRYEKALKTDPGLPEECLGSAGLTLCYWTVWDIAAEATSNVSGAKSTVHQGVRLLASLDSAITYCGATP